VVAFGKKNSRGSTCEAIGVNGLVESEYIQKLTNYPRSIVSTKKEGATVHPTQKPVALMEYLIRTYTNEGETVLDNCMGSGTTGVACANTGRNFIGIEKDDKYFAIAKARIESAMPAPAPRTWTLLDLFGAAA
jgi:site-specific DNA-methyltransferase (adenine-specific)